MPISCLLVTTDHEWPHSSQGGPGSSSKLQGGAGRGELRDGTGECPSQHLLAGPAHSACTVGGGLGPGRSAIHTPSPRPHRAASYPGSCFGQINTLVSKDANSCQGKEDLFLTKIFVGESSMDNYSRLHFLFTLLCLTHTHTHTHHIQMSHTYTHTYHIQMSHTLSFLKVKGEKINRCL